MPARFTSHHSHGQASLEMLLALLILIALLTILALPTNRLLQATLQSHQSSEQAEVLSQTSLDSGILGMAGVNLHSAFTPSGFQGEGLRIRSSLTPNVTAPVLVITGMDSSSDPPHPTYEARHDIPI